MISFISGHVGDHSQFVRISFVRVCEISCLECCKVSKRLSEKKAHFERMETMMKKTLLFAFRFLTFQQFYIPACGLSPYFSLGCKTNINQSLLWLLAY